MTRENRRAVEETSPGRAEDERTGPGAGRTSEHPRTRHGPGRGRAGGPGVDGPRVTRSRAGQDAVRLADDAGLCLHGSGTSLKDF